MGLLSFLFGSKKDVPVQEEVSSKILPEIKEEDFVDNSDPNEDLYTVHYGTKMPIDAIYAYINRDYSYSYLFSYNIANDVAIFCLSDNCQHNNYYLPDTLNIAVAALVKDWIQDAPLSLHGSIIFHFHLCFSPLDSILLIDRNQVGKEQRIGI